MQVQGHLKIGDIYSLISDEIYVDCLQTDKPKMYW